MGLTLKSLIIRSAIAFAAMVVGSSEMAFAIASQNTDHWANTGLNDSHLKKFLTQDKCYSSDNSFVGCIAAINSLLGSGYPIKVLTNKNIQSSEGMGKTIAQLGRLKIQEYSLPAKLTSKEMLDAAIQSNEAVSRSWKTVYSFTKENQISFDKLFVKSLELTSQNYRSLKIANAINEFYKTAIDPHTYIVPTSAREEKLGTSETAIAGIGVRLISLNGTIAIQTKPDGTAALTGVRTFDILLEVNGKSVEGMNVSDVANQIIGDENTPVNLKVARDNQQLSFEILRMKYVQKNIDMQFLWNPSTMEKIAYIRIYSFHKYGVCSYFLEFAKAAKRKGATSVILDLRDNLGGLISEAKCIMSAYLDKGSMLFTENDPATNAVSVKHVDKDGAEIYNLFGNKPLVVLLNGSSASASEMLAGGLRVHNRAVIVGENSFGKGTAQTVTTWDPAGLSNLKGITLMKTTARFHFANGESNQLIGLTPDIEVASEPQALILREKDLYSNAIAPMVQKSYLPGKHIGSIQSCMAQKSLSNSAYAKKLNSHFVTDHQLDVAREAAGCL